MRPIALLRFSHPPRATPLSTRALRTSELRAFILALCIIGCSGLAVPAGGADPPPVRPEVGTLHRLTLILHEGDGAPTAARVTVQDPATGEPYWPEDPAVPIYEAYTGYDYFYAENRIDVMVETGWVRVLASRGPEFTLVDQTNSEMTVRVNHTTTFPDGFGNNETVVVKGLFTQVNGTYVIQSYSMQIGCPSKY